MRHKFGSCLLIAMLAIVLPVTAQSPLVEALKMGYVDLAKIKEQAEAGDVGAQISLADSLASNLRSTEALGWYRKAAAQGSVQAKYRVGHLLLFGRAGLPSQEQTVTADPSEGIRWTFAAATNHHLGACGNLAKAYDRGLGVETNLVYAYAWLQLDADGGSIVSRVELNQMALKLDTKRIEQAQALSRELKAGNWLLPVIRVTVAGDPQLKLGGITKTDKLSLAIINGRTLAEGESAKVQGKQGQLTIRCLKIEKDAVVVAVDGESEPRKLVIE